MDYADAPLRMAISRLGYGIHGGGHERNVKAMLRVHGGTPTSLLHLGVSGNKQHIVEGESFLYKLLVKITFNIARTSFYDYGINNPL